MKFRSVTYSALVVSSALALALVGCGGSNEQATNKANEKAQEKTEQVQKTEEAKNTETAQSTDAQKTTEGNATQTNNSGNASESTNNNAGSSDQSSTNTNTNTETNASTSSDTAGMEAKFTKDQCIYNAKSSTGAGDSATNVTCSDLITGGGTLYYIVEFDLTGAHFRVMVDAIDGGIIDVTESVNGEVINYE